MGSKLEKYRNTKEEGVKLTEQMSQEACEDHNEATGTKGAFDSIRKIDEEDDMIQQQAIDSARTVADSISKKIEDVGDKIRKGIEPSAAEAANDAQVESQNASEVTRAIGNYKEIGQNASEAFMKHAEEYSNVSKELTKVGEDAENKAKTFSDKIRSVFS